MTKQEKDYFKQKLDSVVDHLNKTINELEDLIDKFDEEDEIYVVMEDGTCIKESELNKDKDE